ncbi:MAG: hypothetical protein ACXADD_15780 [Candidatus Thorarchaeota archaeon]|jgi:hypothetical protein
MSIDSGGSRRERKKEKGSRPGEIDTDDVRKAIYHIDAYRSHIFYNLSFLEKMVESGTLGRNFSQKWKKLSRRLIKMARGPTSNPSTVRLARYQSYTEAFWQIAIPIVFILLIVGLIAPNLPVISTIAPYVMIIAFSAMIIGLLGRNLLGARIAKHIEEYFQTNPEAQLLRVEELQSVVQGLINELRRALHQMKEEPEEHLIGIGLLDYDFIEVVKEPRPWRKYYLVKIIF